MFLLFFSQAEDSQRTGNFHVRIILCLVLGVAQALMSGSSELRVIRVIIIDINMI